MKLKSGTEKEYAEYKAANRDQYGGRVVSYGEDWTRLMEARIAAGETIPQMAEATSREADTVGITGFMHGCAVDALSHFWEYGETLLRWHNGESLSWTEVDTASGAADVERTIEDMIARDPGLFHSRTQALHHLFVVLGCGYEWQNGELVERHREQTEDRIPRSAAKILARHRPPLERPPYPYCDLCNLATMPPTAKAAWKAAALEARADLLNKRSATRRH